LAVITISRQLGSLGTAVAQAAADELGYRLVWRESINQAALRAGTPEMALATIDELGLLGLSPSPKERKAYQAALEQVMIELAREGNVVILGRAGQAILHGEPGVLHVRLVAPVQVRAKRLAEKHSIPLDCAMAQIEASDQHRRRLIKYFYNFNWDDPSLYDLIINTGRMAPQAAAALICAALSYVQPSSQSQE